MNIDNFGTLGTDPYDHEQYIGLPLDYLLHKIPSDIKVIPRENGSERQFMMTSNVDLKRWVAYHENGHVVRIRIG